MIYFMDKNLKEIKSGHIHPPMNLFLNEEFILVEYVQADGDELARCYSLMPNLPVVTKRVVMFTGDFAKMIAANWHQ